MHLRISIDHLVKGSYINDSKDRYSIRPPIGRQNPSPFVWVKDEQMNRILKLHKTSPRGEDAD